MWINIGDHDGTNDSDEQTVDSRSSFAGWRFSWIGWFACPHQDSHLHVIPGPTRDLITNAAPEIPAFAGMTNCTIRTVLTYWIVDNGSSRARIGILQGHPGPRPGISPPMPHPEIPAFAGMTGCGGLAGSYAVLPKLPRVHG